MRQQSGTTSAGRLALAALALAALTSLAALAPSAAGAQQRTTRTTRPPKRQTIEIRGQVPTPQVVTVRPRETPSVSRQVLVPQFYDHHFWPSIVPGYQIVSRSLLTGAPPGDTGAVAPRPGAAPASSPASPPASSTPADIRRPPASPGAASGTPPAR